MAAALTIGASPGIASAGPTAQASSGASTQVTCARGWGSTPETRARMVRGPLTNVRTGRHACFDRIVLDVRGIHRPGYDVRYVNRFGTDGEGRVIPLRGRADLSIVVRAPAYPGGYTPTRPLELRDVRGYRTFRQVVWGGSFEGQSSVGLGVRARLPFRVFTMVDHGRSMLVVDVAHRW